MSSAEKDIFRRLRQETLFARSRVYQAGAATPMEKLEIPFSGEVWVKREDVSPIKAYKWRGAYNRMALLSDEERSLPVVAASAGNHAQGVALAATLLGLQAKIYMPRTTPMVKQEAVRKHGKDRVEVILSGDGYDEAVMEAKSFVAKNNGTYIHAYDDLQVIAGQATIADEVVLSGKGEFDLAFLQIGGGGMAAGVANWLKTFYPKIRIIGVEGENQASMSAAIKSGQPVRLEELDIFCDGTAVREAGQWTFPLCRELLDECITVSNEEVSNAIRVYWETLRCLQEPSGAMGLAGLLQNPNRYPSKRCLLVACGANLDFGQLGRISEAAGIGLAGRHHLQIEISESKGSMLELLRTGLGDMNIIDFQYGKVSHDRAWPVFGLAISHDEREMVTQRLNESGFAVTLVDDAVEVRFRAIPCNRSLLSHPLFLELEFYERPGALLSFLEDTIRDQANFCYFNYRYSGERVGRALIGLEFESEKQSSTFAAHLSKSGSGYRRCRILNEEESLRLLS